VFLLSEALWSNCYFGLGLGLVLWVRVRLTVMVMVRVGLGLVFNQSINQNKFV